MVWIIDRMGDGPIFSVLLYSNDNKKDTFNNGDTNGHGLKTDGFRKFTAHISQDFTNVLSLHFTGKVQFQICLIY